MYPSVMRKLSILLVALTATALASAPLTVDGLLKKASEHDGKAVSVKGEVSTFTEKTSRAGNKYTTFVLKGENSVANAYSQGHLDPKPKNGDMVEITGIYLKEKKLKDFTVKNEVNFTKVEGKPYGLKITKKKSG